MSNIRKSGARNDVTARLEERICIIEHDFKFKERSIVTDIRHTIYKPIPYRVAVRGMLLNALAYTDGNQKQAAILLGISTRMINYMLERYSIPRDRKTKVKKNAG